MLYFLLLVEFFITHALRLSLEVSLLFCFHCSFPTNHSKIIFFHKIENFAAFWDNVNGDYYISYCKQSAVQLYLLKCYFKIPFKATPVYPVFLYKLV